MKWDEAYLNTLCKDGEQEGQYIDFKSGDEFNFKFQEGKKREELKKELSRDVSAFGNADGGRIVYGIKTRQENNIDIADHIEPVKISNISDLWFSDVIRNKCFPPPLFSIETIPTKDGTVFVLDIGRSSEPIQADDYIYYQRVASGKQALRAFQIEDIRRRQTSPLLKASLKISGTKFGEAYWCDLNPKNQRFTVPLEGIVANDSITPAKNVQLHLLVVTTSNGVELAVRPENGVYMLKERERSQFDFVKFHWRGNEQKASFKSELVRTWGSNDLPIFKEMPQPINPSGISLNFAGHDEKACFLLYEIYAPGMTPVNGGVEVKYNVGQFFANELGPMGESGRVWERFDIRS